MVVLDTAAAIPSPVPSRKREGCVRDTGGAYLVPLVWP